MWGLFYKFTLPPGPLKSGLERVPHNQVVWYREHLHGYAYHQTLDTKSSTKPNPNELWLLNSYPQCRASWHRSQKGRLTGTGVEQQRIVNRFYVSEPQDDRPPPPEIELHSPMRSSVYVYELVWIQRWAGTF